MTSNVISQTSLVPTASVGFADIVVFGLSGVAILPNGANKSYVAINNFGYNQGWSIESHVRLLCNMAGDNRADIVGFGNKGVWISYNNGDNTFSQPAELVLPDFCIKTGWHPQRHVRFAADIRKVGRCDIVGFGDQGVYVSQNNGDGTLSPAKLVLNNFGFDQNWQIWEHLRFLAPVTGNGLQDIVAFGQDAVYVGRNNGDGTFAPGKSVLNNFCPNQGWWIDFHPRVLGDLSGNGWVDIIGFGDAGVYVSMNDGNGNFGQASKVLDDFGLQQGWFPRNPRFIADLRGTKRGDIIGFGNAGVYVSFGNGDGTFQPAKLVLENFGKDQGWEEQQQRFVADLTGDGCADIVGFGDKYVLISINDGKGGFGEAQKLIQNEWGLDNTVRYLVNLQQDLHKVSKQ